MVQQLTIEFHGIATHFSGVVPGVPHRAVLPDASATRTGMVGFLDENGLVPYALMPHVARVYLPDGTLEEQPTVAGLISSGVVQDGLRIQLANATDTKMTYETSYQNVCSIGEFVENANISTDVVLAGRAAVYLDLLGGTVSAYQDGDATRVRIVVETDGPPELLITPFRPQELAPSSIDGAVPPQSVYCVKLAKDLLVIGNFDLFPTEDPNHDYLWHFTTMQGGIPRTLKTVPPGNFGTQDPVGLEIAADVAVAAGLVGAAAVHATVLEKILAQMLGKMVTTEVALGWLTNATATLASCSDSRYP